MKPKPKYRYNWKAKEWREMIRFTIMTDEEIALYKFRSKMADERCSCR